MNIFELGKYLTEIINCNNNNYLATMYEEAINPILNIIKKDASLLHNISNRTQDEIKNLDIKTFYTEVNLCKTIKRLTP